LRSRHEFVLALLNEVLNVKFDFRHKAFGGIKERIVAQAKLKEREGFDWKETARGEKSSLPL